MLDNWWVDIYNNKFYSVVPCSVIEVIIEGPSCTAVGGYRPHHQNPTDGTEWQKIKTRNNPRHITQCVIVYQANKKTAQSFQEKIVIVFGIHSYNSLPKYFRYMISVKKEILNLALDKFQELIPDGLKNTRLCHAARSNNILDHRSYRRA